MARLLQLSVASIVLLGVCTAVAADPSASESLEDVYPESTFDLGVVDPEWQIFAGGVAADGNAVHLLMGAHATGLVGPDGYHIVEVDLSTGVAAINAQVSALDDLSLRVSGAPNTTGGFVNDRFVVVGLDGASNCVIRQISLSGNVLQEVVAFESGDEGYESGACGNAGGTSTFALNARANRMALTMSDGSTVTVKVFSSDSLLPVFEKVISRPHAIQPDALAINDLGSLILATHEWINGGQITRASITSYDSTGSINWQTVEEDPEPANVNRTFSVCARNDMQTYAVRYPVVRDSSPSLYGLDSAGQRIWSQDLGVVDFRSCLARDNQVIAYIESVNFGVSTYEGYEAATGLRVQPEKVFYLGPNPGASNLRLLADNDDGFVVAGQLQYLASDWWVAFHELDTPQPPAEGLRMFAMGDSYSSGEGLISAESRYECGTDLHLARYHERTSLSFLSQASYRRLIRTNPDTAFQSGCDTATQSSVTRSEVVDRPAVRYQNLCHRSESSYPSLLQKRLQIRDENFESVACSGARSSDITTVSQFPLSPLDVPGGRSQMEALKGFIEIHRGVDLVTLGLGGNDVSFEEVLIECLLSDCTSPAFKDDVDDDLERLYLNLWRTLAEVRTVAGASAVVILFGYPVVVDPNDWCSPLSLEGLSVSTTELTWLSAELIPNLNTVLRDAATAAGVHYLDLSSSLAGHEICSDDGGFVNGLRPGDDILIPGVGPVGRESFHPNEQGHASIADHVVENLRDLLQGSGQRPVPATCSGRVPTVYGGRGTSGPDVILGSSLSDTIAGRGGDDIICAGGGDDEVTSGAGNDVVFAGAGDDRVAGGGEGDQLHGQAGNDTLLGQAGDDVLHGGEDPDSCDGGSGHDEGDSCELVSSLEVNS